MMQKIRSLDTFKLNNLLLYLVVGLVPLILLPMHGKLNTSITKLIALGIITFAYLLLCFFRREEISVAENSTENKFLFAYVALMLISIPFSLDPATSIFGSSYRFDGFLSFLLYFFAYLIARNSRNIGKVVFRVIALTSTLVATLGILQFYNIDPIPRKWYAIPWKETAFSTMGNPNFLGSYLVLCIPVAIYLFFYMEKKYGLLIYALVLLALLCSQTRGAWIGAFVALVVFFILHGISYGFKKRDGMKVLLFALVTLIVTAFFTVTSGDVFLSRLFSIFGDFGKWVSNSEETYLVGSFRIFLWGKVIELIKMRPLTGYGIDSLYIAMNSNFREEIISVYGVYKNWDKAHNEYLNIAVSTGIPSLIAYLGFLFTVLKKSWTRMKRNPGYIALIAAVIGYLTQAMFNIQVVMVFYVFFAYLGILSSKSALADDDQEVFYRSRMNF